MNITTENDEKPVKRKRGRPRKVRDENLHDATVVASEVVASSDSSNPHSRTLSVDVSLDSGQETRVEDLQLLIRKKI